MFKNRRPNVRSSFPKSAGKPPSKPRGSYENGQWLCECNPRVPAEHFQVKKEGKNKGRWFYTCQKHESERCGFFLWDDDAKPRMEAAVLNNSTTESGSHVKKEADTPKRGKKRNLPWQQPQDQRDSNISGDESFDVSDSEEKALSYAVQEHGVVAPPETPRKVQKTSTYETPSSKTSSAVAKTSLLHSLPTPETTPHQPNGAFITQRPDPETPTAVRTKDALAGEDTLTDKVFKLFGLFDMKLDSHASSALRGLLESETRRYQGIIKGRDAARAAVRTRDVRIAELVERCEQLEGEIEADKTLWKHPKLL